MDKIVVICSDRHFPHGDAGGNRIEYMALSLLHKGYQPFVVSMGDNNESDFSKEESVYRYRNIFYYNVRIGKKKSFFNTYMNCGVKAAKIISEIDFKQKNVPVIVYTSNPIFDAQVKRGLKNSEYTFDYFYDVVEWFDSSCYKHGCFDPRYWVFRYCFEKTYCSGRGVIAISKNIQNHFQEKTQNTAYYPICLDAVLFKGQRIKHNDKIKFIYSGNPKHKESIDVVIGALASLEETEKEHIEFHFTGVSKDSIIRLLGEKAYLLDELHEIVIFHQWMDYSKLLSLYHSVDALLMVRKDNLVTKSNFPSKVPELMACGVVVIGNQSGDYFDFLSDGKDAIEIKERSVEATIAAIRKYISLPLEKRCEMSENAIKCAETKFSYKEFSDGLVELLKDSE